MHDNDKSVDKLLVTYNRSHSITIVFHCLQVSDAHYFQLKKRICKASRYI